MMNGREFTAAEEVLRGRHRAGVIDVGLADRLQPERNPSEPHSALAG
jgi:hypothetical protein